MSTPNSTLTAEQAKALFSYDPETGLLRRGDRAITGLDSHGYLVTKVNGKTYKGHRLVWLLQTGVWPLVMLDHKNGVRSDNRWCNLRLATRSENLQNVRAARKQNRSGLLGVSIEKNGKFRSEIACAGRRHNLGTFATAKAAHAAYLEAKKRLHSGFLINGE